MRLLVYLIGVVIIIAAVCYYKGNCPSPERGLYYFNPPSEQIEKYCGPRLGPCE